jgi:hypothetical protein
VLDLCYSVFDGDQIPFDQGESHDHRWRMPGLFHRM